MKKKRHYTRNEDPMKKGEDVYSIILAEHNGYVKGYKEALIDMKRHLNILAIAGKSFVVLDMYKWIDKHLQD